MFYVVAVVGSIVQLFVVLRSVTDTTLIFVVAIMDFDCVIGGITIRALCIIRGGGWYHYSNGFSSLTRNYDFPVHCIRYRKQGFRLCYRRSCEQV